MTEQTQEQQADLASKLLSLLEAWGVSDRDKINLLGLPAETKPRSLQAFHHGTALPDDENVAIRVEHILGISQALNYANPLNERAGIMWLHRRNKRLNGRTPLVTMLDDGLTGITRVRIQLDCSYDWYLDDQRAAAQAQA